MPVFCREGQRGFSLVEVLFALAVIGLALGTSAAVFRTGLLGSESASGMDEALSIASAKIDQAGADIPLQPGIVGGTFGKYAWRLDITPADDSEAAGGDLALFRVAARVTWRDHGAERQVALATLRLQPLHAP
jgi:general secretion pathway protein I